MIAYLLVVLCVASVGLADEVYDHRGHDHDVDHHHPTPPPFSGNETWNVCWREAYCRGEGHHPRQCNESLEFSHGACYKPCDANYTGQGSDCWSNCPDGFQDRGSKCVIPSEHYSPCPHDDPCGHHTPGCRGNCSEGFHPDGCACTKPGQTLTKAHYSRGRGQHPECASNETMSHGECYAECQPDHIGDGPICWNNGTGSSSYTLECNPVSYGANKMDCDQLNRFLLHSGISPPCLAPLAVAINTGDAFFGPRFCAHPIKHVLPELKNATSVC